MPHNALLAEGFESVISTSKPVVGLLDIHGNENACAGKHFDNCLMGMPDSVVDGAGLHWSTLLRLPAETLRLSWYNPRLVCTKPLWESCAASARLQSDPKEATTGL